MKPIKPKLCKICRAEFIPSLTTQKVCGLQCAIKLSRESDKKKRDKQSGKDLLEFNKRDLGWQHKLTQKAFNRMRVLEELEWFKREGCDPYCISCGKYNMDWCCGHYKTVGAQGGLRYDENNTFLQCNRYCNKGLSGNIGGNKTTLGYTKGLLHRFGPTAGDEIIKYCESKTAVKKWTWQELESMRKKFNLAIKALTNES